MKKLLNIILMSAIYPLAIGQQIVGPTTVELNTQTVYQNAAGICGSSCEYFWSTDGNGVIVSQDESEIEIYWTSPGYYKIEIWVNPYVVSEIFLEEKIIAAGNPPTIEYYYDNTGNRYSRQILFLDPPPGGFKSAQISNEELEVNEEDIIPAAGVLSVFPNPTEQILNICVNQEVLESTHKELTLYNSLGSRVLTYQIKDYRNELDMSQLPSGVYILKLVYENKQKEWKIIKN